VFVYLVIAEDGTSHEVRHQLRDGQSAETVIRAAIGGWLELIRTRQRRVTLWGDEDAGLRGRDVNRLGSDLAHLLGGPPVTHVGPIAVTGLHRQRMVSLTDTQVDDILTALDTCRRG
jgi:hypothetical protein